MNVEIGERLRAENALEGRALAELPELQIRSWPSVADRIRQARLRAGLKDTGIAHRLDITVSSYYDLELYDDEAFTGVSLKDLMELGRIVGAPPRTLLLSREEEGGKQSVAFDDVTARLAERVENGQSVEELSDQVGWDIRAVLDDPKSLWDVSVEALYDICKVVDLDWVAALPDADKL